MGPELLRPYRNGTLEERFLARVVFTMMRHPVLVMVAVALAMGGLTWGALQITTDFNPTSFILSDDPDTERREHIRQVFGDNDDKLFIVLAADDIFTPAYYQLTEQLVDKLSNIPNVVDVQGITNAPYFLHSTEGGFEVGPLAQDLEPTPEGLAELRRRFLANPVYVGTLVNPEGTVAAVLIEAKEGHDSDRERLALIHEVQERATAILGPSGAEHEWYLNGIPYVQATYFSLALEDQMMFFVGVGGLFLLMLGFLFGNALGVVAPVVIVLCSNWAVVGILGYAGIPISMISTATPTIIAVYGIADAIHILLRYREEHASGRTKEGAIIEAMVHLGKATFLTSFTTFIGFISLLVAASDVVSSFGLMTGMGVMTAYILSMILMPALMQVFPPMKAPHEKRIKRDFFGISLGLVAGWLPENRGKVLTVAALSIGASVYFSTWVVNDNYLMEELRPDNPVRQAFYFVQDNLTAMLDFEVWVDMEDQGAILEPRVLKAIDDVTAFIEDQPEISKAMSVATFMKAMNQAFHEGDPAHFRLPESRELAAQYKLLYEFSGPEQNMLAPVVDDLNREARIYAMRYDVGTIGYFDLKQRVDAYIAENVPDDIPMRVTGLGLIIVKSVVHLKQDLLNSIGLAFVVISIVLSISFRSIKLGVLSMVPNLLPLLSTLAMMGILGISLRSSTVVIFSISLGIAVDDTIHFLARYYEEVRRDGDVDRAVQTSILTVGRAMLFTSLLLIGGFSVLFLSQFNAIFHFGLLIICTVIGAIAADLIVTPILVLFLRPRGAGVRRIPDRENS